MLKPIRRKILPNTISYKKYIQDSETGASFENEITIKHTAFQLKKVMTPMNDGLTTIANAIIFIDAHNSLIVETNEKPTNELFTENSEVIYNNNTYIVKEVQGLDYENDNGVHHWELIVL